MADARQGGTAWWARIADAPRQGWLWAAARALGGGAQAARGGGPRVCYGVRRVADRAEPTHGGTVKFQSLQDVLPNEPADYNLLYLVSSGCPPFARTLVARARSRGARFAWNQNGVAFPAWHGPGWERTNAVMRELLPLADHVFYQSEFCRRAADTFLGRPRGGAEVLYNAVDTSRFSPECRTPSPLTLLAAGSHWQFDRVRVAVETLAIVRRSIADARLVVAGRFCWTPDAARARAEVDAAVRKAGVAGHVEVVGPYTQSAAPEILRRGHLLVHVKCNDPCPSLVLEAMACGLPVVYADSGGTPELVGAEGGIGLASEATWERQVPPAPEQVAAAVGRIAEDLPRWSSAATRRAAHFDVQPWRRRHLEVFNRLVEQP